MDNRAFIEKIQQEQSDARYAALKTIWVNLKLRLTLDQAIQILTVLRRLG